MKRLDDIITNLIANFLWSLIIGAATFLAGIFHVFGNSIINYSFFGFGLILLSLLFFIAIFFINRIKYSFKLRSLDGKKITLETLNKAHPKLPKFSIIGNSNVGKTTFINNIIGINLDTETTYSSDAFISRIGFGKGKYIALLDCSGESPAQQLNIAQLSNVLIFMVDHNIRSDTSEINSDRINDHLNLGNLLLDKFRNSNRIPKKLFLVINKNDLWKNETNKKSLIDMANSIKTKIKNHFPNLDIDVLIHSNNPAKDINSFKKLIQDLAYEI
jgi:GTPase SAR1 family protein